MRRYFYSFLILVFFLPVILYSQSNGTVTGKLVDQNGNGLPGLTLQLYISTKVYETYSFPDGSFTFNNISHVKDEQLPIGYFVSDNYPNPFNPKTRISITLPNSGSVTVDVYNLLGQKVCDEIKRYFNAGQSYIDLELNELPNGFYIARITLDEKYVVTKKLMLVYGSQHLSSSTSVSNIRLNKSSLDLKIDSLVVTGTSIPRKVFTNLPSMVGNSLNLGNLMIGLPPSQPNLVSPTNGATNISISYTFSWYSDVATSYTLQVSTNNTFSSYFYNQNGLIITSQQISGLSYSTTYYWRVSATNSYGTSQPSTTWSFTTQAPPPLPPILSSPANGAIDLSRSTLLLWNVSSGATSYTVQVSTNNTFSSFVFNLPTTFSTSQQLALDYSTTYYWRVSASNNNGTSDWSSVWSFATEDAPYPPVSPVLLSPANGSSNISLSPTLAWNAVSYSTSYILQISMLNKLGMPNVFNGNAIVYDQNVGNNTSLQLTGLYHSTKYAWQVKALNSYGNSAPSITWTFTTEAGPPCPGIPTIIYEGKIYNTVQIGNQCWLAENLDVGTTIALTQTQSNNGIIEKYCTDPNNCAAAGGLYLWNEAMQYVTSSGNKGICPAGWHIPTLAEFQTLNAAVNGDGSSLKSTLQLNPNFGVTGGTNSSGFSALLAGNRGIRWDGVAAIQWYGEETTFWSSTEHGNPDFAYTLGLSINNSTVTIVENGKDIGISVRCIKD